MGGRCGQVDVEFAFQPIGLALEIHQTLHVVGVVDAGVGGIFAYEGVGGVDGGIGLAALVVGVDQIQLRLARGFAEGKARLQGFELLDGLAVAGILHGLLGPGIDHFGAGFGLVSAVAAAAGGQHRYARRRRAARGSDGQDHAVSQAIPYNGWVFQSAAVYPMPRR